MTRITPSKLALAEECPPALALPQTREAGSIYAARGTAIHAFIATAAAASVDDALAAVPEAFRPVCRKINIAELFGFLGGRFQAEIAVAWSPATDRALLLGSISREEAAARTPEDMIPGVIDAVQPDVALGRLKLADWKTGFQPVEHPKTNRQLRAYAKMAARAYGVEEVEVMAVQFDEDGLPRVSRIVYDAFDLSAIAHEIRETLAGVAAARLVVLDGGSPAVRLGDHCRYCNAQFSCPGMRAAATALVAEPEAHKGLTVAELGVAWSYLSAVEAAALHAKGYVRAQIEAEMERTNAPFQISETKELRWIEVPSEVIDPRVALRVAAEAKLSPAVVAGAMKLSKAAIDRLFEREEDAAEYLGRIRDAGGLETKRTRHLKPCRAGGSKRKKRA